MSDEEVPKGRRDAGQSVAAWLATIEQAREKNDFTRAAQAKRELVRLPVQRSRSSAINRRGGSSVGVRQLSPASKIWGILLFAVAAAITGGLKECALQKKVLAPSPPLIINVYINNFTGAAATKPIVDAN